MTTTLALANQKGGVAKTTSVATLAAALAARELEVLVVDLDPQACLTFALGVDPEDLDLTVHDVLTGACAAHEAVLSTAEGFDLLPATIGLAPYESELAGAPEGAQTVRRALARLAEVGLAYDWILLDCPPSLGPLTVAGLTAADGVVVPVQCETLAHRGVGQLLDTVHDVRERTHPALTVWGVLPTMYDGRSVHARTVLQSISDSYGLEVITPPVPRTVRFAEAPAAGATILTTARGSKGAQAYREIAETLVVRSARE